MRGQLTSLCFDDFNMNMWYKQVCREPDSDDTNEMVFCDGCNLCVHQACYGIEQIPKGSWLCAPCELNIKPQCVLCPNNGGAMKCSRNLRNWCHVSCALWIPEVSFGDADKMEPIINLNKIPVGLLQTFLMFFLGFLNHKQIKRELRPLAGLYSVIYVKTNMDVAFNVRKKNVTSHFT